MAAVPASAIIMGNPHVPNDASADLRHDAAGPGANPRLNR
jgi:hypothetical protein